MANLSNSYECRLMTLTNSSWIAFARGWQLIAMLSLFATGCGGSSGSSEYEAMKQKEAGFADVIAAAGGSAKKEGRSLGIGKPQGIGWFIDLSGDKITDDLIAAIITEYSNTPVFELNLKGSTITDDQLGKLDAGSVLRQMFILDLGDSAITDAGLDKCENVHCLQELRLKGSKATKEGLKRLGQRKIAHKSTPEMFKQPPKSDL